MLGVLVTARKPATFETAAKTLSAEVFREGEICILAEPAESTGGAAPELTPREARALAHWLTLAAEYAEFLESPTDPVEELADAQLGLTGVTVPECLVSDEGARARPWSKEPPPPRCDCGSGPLQPHAPLCSFDLWARGKYGTEPPPTPALPLSARKLPDALCIPVLDDDGAQAFAVVKMTRDGRTVSDMVYAGNRHTRPLLLTDIEKIGGTEDWFRQAREYLVSLGTTPPVRSVPSDQCGNLALNFCSPVLSDTWEPCQWDTWSRDRRAGLSKWHPCSFATLTI